MPREVSVVVIATENVEIAQIAFDEMLSKRS